MANKKAHSFHLLLFPKGIHFFFLQERLPFGLRLNVLKRFENFSSKCFKIFLNTNVSIGCAVVIFHSYKATESMHKYNFTELAATLAG